MSEELNLLGAFLRARRELVTPDDAGVPVLGPRRVPGLRREEVAILAGISADYYLRLERGRDRSPSLQVLESLARILRLGDDTRAYLLSLTADKPRRRQRPRKEVVPPSIAKLVAMLPLSVPVRASRAHPSIPASGTAPMSAVVRRRATGSDWAAVKPVAGQPITVTCSRQALAA